MTEKEKRLKTFEVITEPKSGGINIFFTKGKDGKEALKNLIEYSSDYQQILKGKETYNMTITIKYLRNRKKQ